MHVDWKFRKNHVKGRIHMTKGFLIMITKNIPEKSGTTLIPKEFNSSSLGIYAD